jgi:hypothetical protein
MTHHLVVTRPFLDFARGDIIADVAKISDILSNEHKKFVIKVALPTTSKG